MTSLIRGATFWATAVTLALLIPGCALYKSGSTTPDLQRVEVPVPVPCKVPDIEKPQLYFDNEAEKAESLYDRIKLLLAQNYSLKGYVIQLEAVVQACKATP